MAVHHMTDGEMQLADIIWEEEPIPSGQLVRVCARRLRWKKSTTYTVLRKICENGIFQNQNTIVTSRMSKEEYTRKKGEAYLAEHYDGSLPDFVAAFMKTKKLSKQDIDALAKLIEDYEEE